MNRFKVKEKPGVFFGSRRAKGVKVGCGVGGRGGGGSERKTPTEGKYCRKHG